MNKIQVELKVILIKLKLKEKEDDLGVNRGNPESVANGNSGRRLACCVIRAI